MESISDFAIKAHFVYKIIFLPENAEILDKISGIQIRPESSKNIRRIYQ